MGLSKLLRMFPRRETSEQGSVGEGFGSTIFEFMNTHSLRITIYTAVIMFSWLYGYGVGLSKADKIRKEDSEILLSTQSRLWNGVYNPEQFQIARDSLDAYIVRNGVIR